MNEIKTFNRDEWDEGWINWTEFNEWRKVKATEWTEGEWRCNQWLKGVRLNERRAERAEGSEIERNGTELK